MASDGKTTTPERSKTDESLRTERENADRALAEQLTEVEEDADAIVERAREVAKAVLDTARDKADDKRDERPGRGDVAIARERAREDAVLETERDTADERLQRDREEQALTLAALLPLERQKTDRHLLTERARSDTALAHRDDFMGMVGHDLRNLLSGIVLSARLLSEQSSATDEGRRAVTVANRIERYVARMNRLLGDLIDVVSIDAGKLAVRPERTDVSLLLHEAVEAFAPAAAEQGITLTDEAGEPGLVAHVDRERMLQVLANLIGNALKFTPRGGEVAVRAECANDQLHLCVADTGEGIPGDMLEAVFERFWQVGKHDGRGRGLGLYITKCIIDAHGGRIWAESKHGAGTAFHVVVPDAALAG